MSWQNDIISYLKEDNDEKNLYLSSSQDHEPFIISSKHTPNIGLSTNYRGFKKLTYFLI